MEKPKSKIAKWALGLCSTALLCACGSSPAWSVDPSEGSVYSFEEPESPVAYRGSYATKPVYQIFVGSFADSNGDGIGDLQGIIDKLDYLAKLKVGYLWLSPIHPSSSYHKYDVEDYYDVDPQFGTLDTLRALIDAAKQKGMGIVLDTVFNHASNKNEWFEKAATDYATYYEGDDSCANDFLFAETSAELRKYGTVYEYAYPGHSFYYVSGFKVKEMPEINLDSESVRARQKAILKFYLDMGVSGFRFDGVYYFYLGEDEKSGAYLQYLSDYARSVKPDVFCIGEYWNGTQIHYDNFIGYGKTPIFNFPTSQGGNGSPLMATRSGNSYAYSNKIYNVQKAALNNSEGLVQPSYFVSNHDMDRFVTDSLEASKAVASGLLLTPGTPTMYYGEEIGMRGTRGNADTDANRRLAMHWLADKDQDLARPRDPVGADYSGEQTTLGALEAIDKDDSLTGYYRKVLAFREAHEELQKGIYLQYGNNEEKLAINKVVLGDKVSYIVHNFDYDAHRTGVLPKGLKMDLTLSLGKATYKDGVLTVPPYSTVYLY